MFLPNLATRVLEPEIMDDPALPAPHHVAALHGLERINRISRSADILWPPIRRLLRDSPGPLRILDLATGAGDVPITLMRKSSLPLPLGGEGRGEGGFARVNIEACDISRRALDHAQTRAAAARAEIRFFQHDVLRDGIPGSYDVIACSLFLHHLSDADALRLLERMAAAAKRLVLVNDLRRCRLGHAAAWLGTRLLSRSRVVHADGPQSVRAAFTLDEARGLARRAGMTGAAVEPRSPYRFLLTWTKP